MRHIIAPGGYGDVMRWLPLVELLGEPVLIDLDWWLNDGEFERLIHTLLPLVKVSFGAQDHPDKGRWDIYGNNWKDAWTESYTDKCARLIGVPARYTLSRQAIDRLGQIKQHDHVLFQPHTNEERRRYRHWHKVDFHGPTIQIGGPGDLEYLPMPQVRLKWINTARFLLGSRGLVCVDCSMLHLANILGVRAVCIYRPTPGFAILANHATAVPCMGIELSDPTPMQVSETIKKYLYQ